MSAFGFVKRKFEFEIDRMLALARYPFHKDFVTAKLSSSMPAINIEVTNVCNANCTFCAYQYQERTTGVMSMDLYRKVIDEFVECGGTSVGLTPTVGDPLVDRKLVDRVAYTRSKPSIASIGMYSNMISLSFHGAERLVRSGLTALSVSVSGFDERMYRRVYRSKQYKRVVANIKEFARVNNAAGNPVEFQISIRSDRPLRETFSYPDHLEIADLVGEENICLNFFYDSWIGKITQDQLTGGMKLRRVTNLMRPRISPCSELYSGPMVYWDGKVGACGCRDVDARELIIGNVNNQHLGEIWFGSEIEQLRREFLTEKIRPICQTCTHYSNLSICLTKGGNGLLQDAKPSPYLRPAMH